MLNSVKRHVGTGFSTVDSQQEGCSPVLVVGRFYVEFACYLSIGDGFLWAIWFPSTVLPKA